MREINVAVVGATGAVGEAMLEILATANYTIGKVYPLASERSAGNTVLFSGKPIDVLDLAEFDFSLVDIALFSAGGSVSAEYAPIAAEKGCIVIDNTSHFRYDKDVPLVVPEVNPEDIEGYTARNIIANPNCSTIQMLVALGPLYKKWGISEIVVSTYQAVSGAGKKAVTELVEQTTSLLGGRAIDEGGSFSRQMAFNVVPQIDVWQDNEYSKEEMKMVWETRKILKDDKIIVNPTAVRVPTCYGHAESIHVKLTCPVNKEMIVQELRKAKGLEVFSDPEDFPTPFEHGSGTDLVAVGRIREALGSNDGINMWVVADNVRKGAALNAVQISELLVNNHIIGTNIEQS